MSSEKIQLPNFLIASLYKDYLVEVASPKQEATSINADESSPLLEESYINSTHAIKYLGQNKKGIIAIVSDGDADFINDTDRTFLTNVLKACSLAIDDIAIINMNGRDVSFSVIKEQLDAENILLFDVEPSSINLPFSIPYFQVQRYAGCTIITAPALSTLNQPVEQSRSLKSQLWNSLKQMFNIA